MKNNLRPISISYYLIMLALLAIISVATTILLVKTSYLNILDWSLFRTIGMHVGMATSHILMISTLKLPAEVLGLFVFIFTIILLIMCILKICYLIKSREVLDYHYVSGPQLLEGTSAIMDVKKRLLKEPSKLAFNIHPQIQLTEQIEAGSILIQGQSGAGKSTIVKPFVQQIYCQPVRSFTYDEKGEYQATFNSDASVCLQLSNEANYFWDIGKDIVSSNEAALVAHSMIEQEKENQRFFTDAARQIFKYVIVFLVESKKSWSWRDLSTSLFSTEHELKSLLSTVSASAAKLIEPGSKTTQSILSVLSTQLFWLDDMAKMQDSAKNRWTISDLIAGDTDKSHIFFRPNYTSPDLSKAVCNSLITLLIERWMSRNDSSQDRLWLLLDELGNLPKNPSLIRWLTLSRSKGGRTLATTQNLSQLYESYGENVTETILSLFRTVIVMRLGASGPSAQKASDLLGQQRVVTLNQNLSEDQKIAISTQYQDRPIVSREAIINLPSADKKGVVGFLFIGGLLNIYKLKWPYLKQLKQDFSKSESSLNNNTRVIHQNEFQLKNSNRLNKRKALQTSIKKET